MSTTTNLGTSLKTDALAALAPTINQFLDNIIANPTPVNVSLQAIALQGNLLASSVALEGVGIKDVATALKVQFNSLIAPKEVTIPAIPAA